MPEAETHRIESAIRPDLPVELLHELSRGLRLPDRLDVRALALALPRCPLVTSDAFMADVVHRSRLPVRFRCEIYTGRRPDVERLLERLEQL